MLQQQIAEKFLPFHKNAMETKGRENNEYYNFPYIFLIIFLIQTWFGE